MTERQEIEARLRRHVEAVAAAVGGPSDQQEEICDNVEAQIRLMLAARGAAPTVADLEAVLAEVDPPASFAGEGKEPVIPPPRRAPLWGCLMMALGVLILGVVVATVGYLAVSYDRQGGGGPMVVATVPVQGDTLVDPALAELSVTFDRPMMTRQMWSWCMESPDTWPELDPEGVRYVDDRTCVAPVELMPDRTYVIWFNTDRYDAFRDREQRPAVPYRLEFTTGSGGG